MRRMKEQAAQSGTNRNEDQMGFKIQPQETKAKSVATDVPVPDDVANSLSELWDYIQQNPNYVALVTFDTTDEVKPFIDQARSWAAAKMVNDADGKSKPLGFRQLPIADGTANADKIARFSLSAPLTDKQEAEKAAKRKEVRAKNKAAKAAKTASDAPTPLTNEAPTPGADEGTTPTPDATAAETAPTGTDAESAKPGATGRRR